METCLTHIKSKTDRFKSEKYVLPREPYDVLIKELESLARVIDEVVESNGYLMCNDPDKKEKYEENLLRWTISRAMSWMLG